MDESYLQGIRTRFVRDRLKETSWARRDYIEVLRILEQVYQEGGASGVSKTWHGQMRQRYPVEDECIRKEIQEGVYTPPEEFHRLVKEWEEEQRRKKAEWMQQKCEQEQQQERERLEEDWMRQRWEQERQERGWPEEERRKWLEAGGKP